MPHAPRQTKGVRLKRNVLIPGAPYGSLLASKLLMADRRATLVRTRVGRGLTNKPEYPS